MLFELSAAPGSLGTQERQGGKVGENTDQIKFELILTDPPWRYNDKSRNRGGAERHYGTLSLDQLKAINLADYAAKHCCLMMWTTGPQLADSIDLMRAWGFKYSTFGFIWVKRSRKHWENSARRIRQRLRAQFKNQGELKTSGFIKAITAPLVMAEVKDRWFWGMGSMTRACAEVVLLGTKGSPAALRKDKGVHQVIEEIVGEHSAKPDEVYERIERLFGDQINRLDMFTRRNRPGWFALGDQVDRTDYILCSETMKMLPVKHEPVQEVSIERVHE